MKLPPTVERLRELLSYNPSSGIWRWRGDGKHKAGKIAGTKHVSGYIQIRVDYQLWMAHRLAWLYVYDQWPGDKEIDHINRDKGDNRIANLRLATRQQQRMNSPKNRNNTGGYKGIWRRGRNWVAELAHRKLGTYPTREQAAQAYLTAAIAKYGGFASD